MLAITKIVPAITPGLTAKPKATNREDYRSRHQRRFYKIPSSITFFCGQPMCFTDVLFWTTDLAGPVKCGAMGQTFHHTRTYDPVSCLLRQRIVR